MLSNLRKLRFSSKVKIEREVLTMVNSAKISSKYKLAGMTKEAVLTWHDQIAGIVSVEDCNAVMEKLLEISRNAHIISDTSRVVFAEGFYFDNAKYIADKEDLRKLLNLF